MDRLTKLAAFKSKAKHQWKEEWDDAQRRIVTKLMSRAHPAFKKDERRWTSIQWAVNNPPLTEEEQKEKDKRDAIRKKRAECLAGDAREQKKAPPDPGPEPTAEERGVPQRTCEVPVVEAVRLVVVPSDCRVREVLMLACRPNLTQSLFNCVQSAGSSGHRWLLFNFIVGSIVPVADLVQVTRRCRFDRIVITELRPPLWHRSLPRIAVVQSIITGSAEG